MSYRDCLYAVAKAAGRTLSDDEIRDIYERVHKAALDVKAGRAELADVEISTKRFKQKATAGLLIEEAVRRASEEMIFEAQIKQKQAHLQLAKMSARLNNANKMQQSGIGALDAVDRSIFRNYDGKTDVQSLEQLVTGTRSYFNAKLAEVLEVLDRKWFQFLQDKDKTLALVREMLGEKSGDPIIAKAAQTWRSLTDESLAMMRDKGGVIGKLDESYVPQGWWDQVIVARYGRDQFIDYMLPVLEKTQAKGKYYVDDLGTPWDRQRLREFIGKSYDSISTNGYSNTQPGQYQGGGGVARRHSEHRQIHFPDAESVIAAWKEFGGKNVPEILLGHINAMSRDIALMEWGGPNPQLTYRTLRDQALTAEVMADRANAQVLEARANRLDSYFDTAIGKVDPIAHPKLHRFVSNILPINVMAKLGGAMWASLFGDKVMFEAVRHLNNLPALQTWRTELALLNPANAAERRLLMRQGLMLDQLRGAMNRFGEEIGGAPLADKGANLVMGVTGMNLVNNGRKAALGVVLFDAIGSELATGKRFADLHASDTRILKSYGITEIDWKVWKLAKLEDIGHGNDTALTPSAIGQISDLDIQKAGLVPTGPDGLTQAAGVRRDAIIKLLGAVNSEVEFGVVTPGMREHAQFRALGNNRSAMGEIGKTILQFKSFPWAQFQRMLDAVANKGSFGGKAAMSAYLLTASTLAGAMILQTREMLTGKDPRPMDDWRFWAAAFIQGGSLGLYGDFLYSVNSTRYGSGPIETMLGPTVGPLLEMAAVQPLNFAKRKMEGKETHFWAQTIQDTKSFVPGSNIWFSKAVVNHFVWDQTMEALSPGYLSSIRRRTRREYGQDWWWRPGELTPDRAPDVEATLGR